MSKNIIVIKKSFVEVFRRPTYLSLFVSIASAIFLASLWLTRYKLLVVFSGFTKIKMFWFLLTDLGSTFTLSSLSLVIALSVLTAIHVAMMTFYIKRRISLERKAGLGFFGMLFGFLGVGCASCGSLILSSIFGLSATASFIGVFPLKGLEFGILGVLIILFSIYLVAKKIQNPLMCKIDY